MYQGWERHASKLPIVCAGHFTYNEDKSARARLDRMIDTSETRCLAGAQLLLTWRGRCRAGSG